MRRQRSFSADSYAPPQAGAAALRRFGRRKMAPGVLGKASARAPYTTFFFILIIIFLVVFPKGGVKVGNVPVTIGYVMLGLVTILASARFLTSMHNLPQNALAAWLFTLPFQLTLAVTYFTLGVTGDSITLLIVLSTSFIFMPTAFLLILAPSFRFLKPETVKRVLVLAIRFICVFGLVLFAAKTFTGLTIEIPFLTVNLDDTDALGSKNNTRGELFKLISTYNNGNIFGICLGMMLPFYYFIERKRIFFLLAIVCMVLTLSRTAWIAVILILMAIAWIDNLRPSRIIGMGIMGLFFIAALPFLVEAMGRDTSAFLLDSNLGNRARYLDSFDEFYVEPRLPLRPFVEMVYATAYQNYGAFGVIAFLLFFAGPIAVTMLGDRGRRTTNRAAAAGLAIYMIVAMSDGAILLIPTMAIFFMVALIALELDDEVPVSLDTPVGSGAAPPARGFRALRLQAGESGAAHLASPIRSASNQKKP